MFREGDLVVRKPENYADNGNFWVNRCDRYGFAVNKIFLVTGNQGEHSLTLEGFAGMGFTAASFLPAGMFDTSLDSYL